MQLIGNLMIVSYRWLSYKIFESASMILSNISNINLIGADIKGIFFDSNQVVELEKNYDLKGSKIYIIDKKKIVMYEEYN